MKIEINIDDDCKLCGMAVRVGVVRKSYSYSSGVEKWSKLE